MAWPDLSDMRTRVRDLVKESTAGFYTDAEINRWSNDGERDVAIKSLCIQSINVKATVANTRTISTPYNKVLYVEYVPGSGTPIGLIKISPLHLGHVPKTSITPQYWFPWGKKIGIEPMPTAAYNLNVYASTLPTIEMSEDTDEPQIPKALMPLIVRFAFYRALLKAGLFKKSASVYSDYITGVQIARNNIVRQYRDRFEDTMVPNRTITEKEAVRQ